MTQTLQELIDRSYDIKIFFRIGSYELHHYEDGSFTVFRVQKVVDLKTLVRLAGDLELRFFVENEQLIVRLFERDSY